MDIKYVRREDIDKMKWNTCIYHAMNGNVFGYVWFLDQVAKQWDALIEGDYESVMPLVWRKHWSGNKEIFQPLLMRELGIFSIRALSQKRVETFISAIPETYRFVSMTLNERNGQLDPAKHDLELKTNHQMLLEQPYEVLRSNYSSDLLKQLSLASNEKFTVTTSIKPEKVADFFKKHNPVRKELDKSFHALQRIMYNLLHRGWGYASAISDDNDQLLACNFFAYSHSKAISLIPLQSPSGEMVGALPYLMDVFIRNHANKAMILDLNTSPGGEQLNRNLGAQVNHYYTLNRIPEGFLGKWMAKL